MRTVPSPNWVGTLISNMMNPTAKEDRSEDRPTCFSSRSSAKEQNAEKAVDEKTKSKERKKKIQFLSTQKQSRHAKTRRGSTGLIKRSPSESKRTYQQASRRSTGSTGSGGACICWELGGGRAEVDQKKRLGQLPNRCRHYDPQWQVLAVISAHSIHIHRGKLAE